MRHLPRTILLLLVPTLACNVRITAFMEAVMGSGDTAAQVRINFTKAQSGFEGDKLRLTFSNPEGDSMEIKLSPKSGGFATDESYMMDTSQNSFTALINVVSSNQTIPYQPSANDGFVNLTSVDVQNDVLYSASGDFHVNFDIGGTGNGWFQFQAQ